MLLNCTGERVFKNFNVLTNEFMENVRTSRYERLESTSAVTTKCRRSICEPLAGGAWIIITIMTGI